MVRSPCIRGVPESLAALERSLSSIPGEPKWHSPWPPHHKSGKNCPPLFFCGSVLAPEMDENPRMGTVKGAMKRGT